MVFDFVHTLQVLAFEKSCAIHKFLQLFIIFLDTLNIASYWIARSINLLS